MQETGAYSAPIGKSGTYACVITAPEVISLSEPVGVGRLAQHCSSAGVLALQRAAKASQVLYVSSLYCGFVL